MNKYPLWVVLDNLRSTANVGSILRTSEALGVERVYACGYTPYPLLTGDTRPPHVASSNTRSIAKTSLGAENMVDVRHTDTVELAITKAVERGFTITVLEQTEKSLMLNEYRVDAPTVLVLGNEVEGVSPAALALANVVLEIPMLGRKESFGVAVAAGIALHHLRLSRS